MNNPKINFEVVFCVADEILDYEDIAYDFFRRILKMDYEECITTDESFLSDFSSCGMPECNADCIQALYTAWDIWVVEKINRTYSISLTNTNLSLIDLFKIIEDKNGQEHF